MGASVAARLEEKRKPAIRHQGGGKRVSLLTLGNGSQQAHLLACQDSNACQQATFLMQLCYEVPIGLVEQESYKDSHESFFAFDYESHQLFDHGEAIIVPTDSVLDMMILSLEVLITTGLRGFTMEHGHWQALRQAVRWRVQVPLRALGQGWTSEQHSMYHHIIGIGLNDQQKTTIRAHLATQITDRCVETVRKNAFTRGEQVALQASFDRTAPAIAEAWVRLHIFKSVREDWLASDRVEPTRHGGEFTEAVRHRSTVKTCLASGIEDGCYRPDSGQTFAAHTTSRTFTMRFETASAPRHLASA